MDNWFICIIAGLPALYYGGLFWGEVTRRLLAVSLLLIGCVAKLVAAFRRLAGGTVGGVTMTDTSREYAANTAAVANSQHPRRRRLSRW